MDREGRAHCHRSAAWPHYGIVRLAIGWSAPAPGARLPAPAGAPESEPSPLYPGGAVLTGLLDISVWGVVAYTLAVTHLTIICVTVFLHRHKAHRALDLHPLVSHPMRFWLWLTTGMVTKQWMAVHRKHHACVESEQDPHSPRQEGIATLLLEGTELYRKEAGNEATLLRYGHGAPDDWIERNLYTRWSSKGYYLMLGIDVAALRAHRPDGVGDPDALDPGARGRSHKRGRSLVGLPKLRNPRHVHQYHPLRPAQSEAKSFTTITTPSRAPPSSRRSGGSSMPAGSTSGFCRVWALPE